MDDVLMIVVGIAFLVAAFMIFKNRVANKSRDDRRSEMYSDYEEKMKNYRK